MSDHKERADLAHLNLVQAVHHALKAYPGGLKGFAGVYGYNANTLQLKADPAQLHSLINIHELEDVLTGTRSPLVLDAIGRAANCCWVDLGAFGSAGDLDVLDTITELVQSVGRMTGELHKSLADGEVDKKELARLQNHLSQLTACGKSVIELAKKYVRE